MKRHVGVCRRKAKENNLIGGNDLYTNQRWGIMSRLYAICGEIYERRRQNWIKREKVYPNNRCTSCERESVRTGELLLRSGEENIESNNRSSRSRGK